ncbi:MAG: hypothetical protein R3F62_24135 [Planctomycetota bacterium]
MTAPRRRRWTRCLGCGVVLALSLAILVLVFLARLAPMGAAYQAKVLASGVFVSGRASEDVLAEDLDPAELSFLLRLCRSTVDEGSEQASATFAGVDAARVVWRRGLGTTIVVGELQDVPPPPVVGPPCGPQRALAPRRGGRRRPAPRGARATRGPRRAPGRGHDRARGAAAAPHAGARRWRGRIVGERYAPGFTPDMLPARLVHDQDRDRGPGRGPDPRGAPRARAPAPGPGVADPRRPPGRDHPRAAPAHERSHPRGLLAADRRHDHAGPRARRRRLREAPWPTRRAPTGATPAGRPT